MVMSAKIGTLKDFANAKRMLEKAGIKVTVKKSPNDLTRKLIIGGNVVALSIARLGGNRWSFLYNDKVFQRK